MEFFFTEIRCLNRRTEDGGPTGIKGPEERTLFSCDLFQRICHALLFVLVGLHLCLVGFAVGHLGHRVKDIYNSVGPLPLRLDICLHIAVIGNNGESKLI
ncbi:hypothetical protein BV22DRAFT_832614 [Leucogyrophana mollusca]|uniref:Uncharacterized protein n=1 Tax=Leucogyrophana mollusca TaxID=85980 RepID=A0ACB8B367_9AGAM|nr:hypothetical protein BV22DRAFT_832614 [Leucogyrophana mollusca]